MALFIWLFFVRFCAYQGRRRVIGWFDGMVAGGLLGILGLFIILSSRRLDDKHADAALMEKYKAIRTE